MAISPGGRLSGAWRFLRSNAAGRLAAPILATLLAPYASPGLAQDSTLIGVALTHGTSLAQVGKPGSPAEVHVAGLVIDGDEVDTLEIVFIGSTYYLPVQELAQHIGARVTQVNNRRVAFDTPGGTAALPTEALLHRDSRVFIGGDALREHLATENHFDPAAYAVVLELPWWRSGDRRQSAATKAPVPDRLPPRASLSQMRLDYNFVHGDDYDRHLLDYRLDGALLDGGWRVNLTQDPDEDTYLREYHWVQAKANSQVLIGRQDALLHPLFPSTDFTGGQLFLSNRELDPVLGYTITRSDFARNLARPQQDITGTAKPGSVAELRVEGRIVARQRVRLDGYYEFLDVTFPSRGYSQVEVFVRDSRAGSLIEVQDHSRSASQLMLDAGHQVATFGAGAAGNLADPNDVSDGGVGIAQWRAGISETLTLEAAYQGADGRNATQLGLIKGLGKNWVASLGLVADEGGSGGMLELFGYGEQWNLDYVGRETGEGYLDHESASLHDMNFRYFATRALTLGGRGRYADGIDSGETFVLPGFRWTTTNAASLSMWPNVDGEYRVDANYRPTPNSQVRYSYEEDEHRLLVSQYAASGVEYYFDARDRDGRDARFESGMRWSIESDDRSRFELAAISTESGELGYYGRAEKTFVPGIYASLEVRDEPYLESEAWRTSGASGASALSEPLDPGLTVQFRVTMDYSLANGRLVPASTTASDMNVGSIAGRFQINGDLPIPPDLEKITLMIDGRPHSTPSRDGRFHIGGLRPGIYRVRLDPQSLPIELVPGDESLWVKVAHAAVTKVDFQAELQFGVAGRVTRGDGSFATHSKLWILDEAGAVQVSTYTDQWGLYRADGLTPGTYRVEVVGDDAESIGAGAEFVVADDFVFGVDLTLSDPLAF